MCTCSACTLQADHPLTLIAYHKGWKFFQAVFTDEAIPVSANLFPPSWCIEAVALIAHWEVHIELP